MHANSVPPPPLLTAPCFGHDWTVVDDCVCGCAAHVTMYWRVSLVMREGDDHRRIMAKPQLPGDRDFFGIQILYPPSVRQAPKLIYSEVSDPSSNESRYHFQLCVLQTSVQNGGPRGRKSVPSRL